MASSAVACGLKIKDLAFKYYDAHNDLDPPDVHENGYVNPWICPYSKVKVGRLDFVRELITQLERRSYSPALVHVGLDVLGKSCRKDNDYPSLVDFLESDLIACMNLIPKTCTPKSLTVSSFDSDAGDGDKIAQIAIRINTFVQSL
ncbi:arginase protein [Schizosaccharomyces osmophilus]|uniref:Arginase protein n=1 Tax=Schizosaccharomyces osmophilus TaxID=2545709 RepID=A0AAF0AYB7_9SCHI|nr:arginase protein [Schizosaccharomyces osmophilus]WBW75422.1 arginase protein [Schizosaccharomyces osmophilus]